MGSTRWPRLEKKRITIYIRVGGLLKGKQTGRGGKMLSGKGKRGMPFRGVQEQSLKNEKSKTCWVRGRGRLLSRKKLNFYLQKRGGMKLRRKTGRVAPLPSMKNGLVAQSSAHLSQTRAKLTCEGEV